LRIAHEADHLLAHLKHAAYHPDDVARQKLLLAGDVLPHRRHAAMMRPQQAYQAQCCFNLHLFASTGLASKVHRHAK
jgi:hypothetical protein